MLISDFKQLPVLSSDIRKLPAEVNGRRSRTKPLIRSPTRSGSVTDDLDTSTTAVSVAESSITSTAYDSRPSVRYTNSTAQAKRKKPVKDTKTTRYWSEYDHPEDGSDDDGGYYIYVDPEAEDSMIPFKDVLTNWLTRFKKVFSRNSEQKRAPNPEFDPLLGANTLPKHSLSESSMDSDTSSSSSDEEDEIAIRYGTIFNNPSARDSDSNDSINFLVFSAMSLFSSTTISLVLLVLSEVSRRRAHEEVDIVTIIGVIISLLFGIGGFWGLVSTGQAGLLRWMVGLLAFGLIATVDTVLVVRALMELRSGG